MKKWSKEVNNVNGGVWKPSQFTEAVFGKFPDWVQWQTAYWMYTERGGKLGVKEFMKEAPKSPVPYKKLRWFIGILR